MCGAHFVSEECEGAGEVVARGAQRAHPLGLAHEIAHVSVRCNTTAEPPLARRCVDPHHVHCHPAPLQGRCLKALPILILFPSGAGFSLHQLSCTILCHSRATVSSHHNVPPTLHITTCSGYAVSGRKAWVHGLAGTSRRHYVSGGISEKHASICHHYIIVGVHDGRPPPSSCNHWV